MNPNAMPTTGTIAAQLGQPLHRVEYIIRSRGLRPSGWAGNCRVFSQADVERIRVELARVQAEKEARHE